MGLDRRTLLARGLLPAVFGGLPWRAWPAAAPPVAPLLDGMGDFRVDDASPMARARRYCAQGFVQAWSFHAAEAARAFDGALAQDPQCALAAWGQAWALGPTLNADLAPDDAPRVEAALQRARALRGHAAPRWREAIDALALRHPGPGRIDEEAYARRMRALSERRPRDADLATLAAEALMSLHPYDWWRPDGRPQPWTAGIQRLLGRALGQAPRHPGANHAWVHLFESSPTPARALAAADRLRTLVPGSAHLLHMPAHIDMRLGRYAAASEANERALQADRRYLAQVDAQGAYRVGYVAHNHHFLWASAAMQGRSARAIAAADEAYLAACGPRVPQSNSGTLQHFLALPLLARVRFGHWQSLLTGTRPPEGNDAYPRGIWHYARGTAWLRTGEPDRARAELAQLGESARDPALARTRVKQVHAATALLEIAQRTLQADLALAAGRVDEGLADLQRAVQIEDGLQVDEPHLWLAPTRHALGAALLAQGRAAAAQQVFLQDLAHYPENGWSLAGLAGAQRALGRLAQAQATEARQRLAWRDADMSLGSARF